MSTNTMIKRGGVWILALALAGCATIKGSTPDEQRAYILKVRDETLSDLYESDRGARDKVRAAEGYGVFSSINTHLFLLSSANGFGAVTDAKTGKVTYMKMASAGGGLGLGMKDFRVVIVFKKRDDLEKFVDKGWEFKGQADAALKAGGKGGAVSGAQTADLDVITYQLTESGAALQATLQGTKYWKYKKLNEPSS